MISLLVSALLAAGLFLILCDARRMPTLRTAEAVSGFAKRRKKKEGTLERWRRDLASWLSKHLRLNEYKRLQLAADLQSADMDISPELHIADAVVGAVPVGLLAIPTIELAMVATIPAPFSTVMFTGDMRGVIGWAVCLAVDLLIWYPFFKTYEKQEVEKEAAEALAKA
mgnify:CR=1 FL=1